MQKELGYRIAKVQRLFELCASPAAIMEKMVFFTCANSPAQGVQRWRAQGGGGRYRVVETTLPQAAAMIAAGEIIGAKTVVLVQYLINGMQATACS